MQEKRKGKSLKEKGEKEGAGGGGGGVRGADKARSAVNSHCLSAASKLCID